MRTEWQIAVLAALAVVLATPAAAAEAGPNFDIDWDEAAKHAPALPAESEPGRRPNVPTSPLRLGTNSVKVGAIGGAPGAEIAPDNSNLSVGVGLAPAIEKDRIDLDGDVTGALQLRLDDGPVTPSMTLRGPVPGSGDDGQARDVRTMFGLGYKF